eukprot:2289417-Amphidinium_carterae.1
MFFFLRHKVLQPSSWRLGPPGLFLAQCLFNIAGSKIQTDVKLHRCSIVSTLWGTCVCSMRNHVNVVGQKNVVTWRAVQLHECCGNL